MADTHTVKRGDTLGKIAREFYGDASKYPLIVAANDITNPDQLRVGQALVILDQAVADRAAPTPSPVWLPL